MQISLSSANVLTLQPGFYTKNVAKWCKEAEPRVNPREKRLMQQFDKCRINIVRLQETRYRCDEKKQVDGWWCIHTAANKKHGSIALWVSLRMPYGKDSKGKSMYFEPAFFRVLLAEPEHLIVRRNAPHCKSIFVIGHAPARQEADMQKFSDIWERIKTATSAFGPTWNLFTTPQLANGHLMNPTITLGI